MNKINWKLRLAYDGTEFHGWQVQLDRAATPTVQGILAEAIAAVTGEHVLPQGAGRTDAGVHASAQVASFSLAAPIPAENFQRALNRVLPAAIRVLSAEPAAPDFHARHSATGKVYQYRIFSGLLCPPFLARYVTCSRGPLDLNAMQLATQAIVGEQDFTSFAATDPDRVARAVPLNASQEPNSFPHANVRRIEQSDWSSSALPPAGANAFSGIDASYIAGAEIFTYTVRGNGFLHHMVRNLVGTFIEIGRGRVAPSAMAGILEGRDRALAGPTAPAQGLCLMKVLYEAGRKADTKTESSAIP